MNKPSAIERGQRISKAIKAKGVTLDQMANDLNDLTDLYTPPSELDLAMLGVKFLKSEYVLDVCKYLDLPLSVYYFGEGKGG